MTVARGPEKRTRPGGRTDRFLLCEIEGYGLSFQRGYPFSQQSITQTSKVHTGKGGDACVQLEKEPGSTFMQWSATTLWNPGPLWSPI